MLPVPDPIPDDVPDPVPDSELPNLDPEAGRNHDCVSAPAPAIAPAPAPAGNPDPNPDTDPGPVPETTDSDPDPAIGVLAECVVALYAAICNTTLTSCVFRPARWRWQCLYEETRRTTCSDTRTHRRLTRTD